MVRVDRGTDAFPSRLVSGALDEFELPLAVVDLDDFKVLAVSDLVVGRLGLPADELVGRVVGDLMSPSDATRAHLALEAVGSGAVDFYRAHHALRSGRGSAGLQTEWVRAVVMAGRRVALVQGGATDDAESPMARYLGSEPGAVALGTASRSWIVDAISTDVVDILGITPDSLIGRPLTGLIHADDLERFSDADRRARGRVSVGLAVRMRHADLGWSRICVLITSLAATHDRAFIAFVEPEPRVREVSRAADMERHLWRIAAEVRASGVLERLGMLADKRIHPQLAGLSERQWEVVSRLMQGQRVPTIAEQLTLSESTIRNHLSAVFARFGVHSQAELLSLLAGEDV